MNITKKIGVVLCTTPILLFSHGLEWWMVPFAITSSPTLSTTAHLDKKKPKGYSSETFEFVKNNRETLQVQVAQGDGEALDTLASIYRKMDEKKYVKDIDKWKKELQKNYDKIFYRDGVVGDDEYVDYMLFDITLNSGSL